MPPETKELEVHNFAQGHRNVGHHSLIVHTARIYCVQKEGPRGKVWVCGTVTFSGTWKMVASGQGVES